MTGCLVGGGAQNTLATQPVPCHSTQTTFLPDSLESKVCMPDYLAAREAESRRLSARAPPRGRTHVLERV